VAVNYPQYIPEMEYEKKMKTNNDVRVLVAGVAIALLSQSLSSQPGEIHFEAISIESGLSQSTVVCICQDQKNFLWFGTYNGLNRYDGYDFKVYKNDPDNPHSLSNNNIQYCIVDHNGTLWVGTENGLNRFIREKEQFIQYTHDPNDSNSLSSNYIRYICEDRSGTLWVGTQGGGLNRFDSVNERFIHYRNTPDNPRSLNQNNVLSILEDSKGRFWVGTDGGLNRLDRQTGEFSRYQHDPRNPLSISSTGVWRITEDRDGNLWLGLWGGGVNLYDPQKNQFTHYQNNPNDPTSLSYNIIRSIFEDHIGNLWIGTDGGGLNKFIKGSGQNHPGRFIHYQNNSNDLSSLSNNSVLSIYEDRSGILWIGTKTGGVNKYDPGKRQFAHYKNHPNNPNSVSKNTVHAVYEDHQGYIWIGTKGGGLDCFDRKKNLFTHYINDPKDSGSLSNNVVRCIREDRYHRIWVGTDNGLNCLRRETGKFIRYRNDPGNPYSIGHNSVWSIYEDRSGTLWIGTAGAGLQRFDEKKNRFYHYAYDQNNPSSISDNALWTIYEDSSGIMWIGTLTGGLNRFDRATGKFIHYTHDNKNPQSISDNKVMVLREDRSGILWVGTSDGLNMFDREGGIFRHYGGIDGLPNNNVQGMLEDESGYLWISTSHGLSKFNPGTGKFKNYFKNYGLQSNEFEPNACCRLKTGELVFAGINGFNIFHPNTIVDDSTAPRVVITDFQIFNKSVPAGMEIGGRTILQQSITDCDEIHLTYQENVFSFQFAALLYTSPMDIRYAYMMEGFENQWNYTDANRRFVTYTNLPGGEYTFRVKATNNQGIWAEPGTSVRIAITPPYWKTLWFYLVCAFVLIVISGGAYRVRMHQIRIYEQELQDKVVERTRELALEIAERKRAEESLLVQNTALQSAANSILITDRDGIIISANKAFSQLTGYPQEEVVGNKPNILKSGSQSQSFYKKLWETILSGEVWKGEIENKRKDGSLYLEEMTITPVRKAGGEISHFIAIKQDITERKRLQHQLFQAQKVQSIGTLAGGIAHDFNNILGIILGYSSLLENRGIPPQKIYESINAITKAGERGAALVRQILTFAHQTDISLKAMSVHDLVHEVQTMLTEMFPKTITILEYIPRDLPAINADHSQMHQVFLNLCVNARDAMPNGGTITIDGAAIAGDAVRQNFPAAQFDRYVRIRVSDTGIGMDTVIKSQIFDPFFTTKGQGKGTGLGLSVVYGVIQSHRGYIDVETEPGRGTTFTIYLPVFQSYGESTMDKNTLAEKTVSGSETILIVEDETLLRDMLIPLIESYGYTVYIAHDGQEALEVFMNHRSEIAVVFTDMGLPKMSGTEEFTKLKEIDPHVKVIFSSGFLSQDDKSELFKKGAKGFIQKPYKPDEVLSVIREVLDNEDDSGWNSHLS
jgi:PAS domain S-box-containing protein